MMLGHLQAQWWLESLEGCIRTKGSTNICICIELYTPICELCRRLLQVLQLYWGNLPYHYCCVDTWYDISFRNPFQCLLDLHFKTSVASYHRNCFVSMATTHGGIKISSLATTNHHQKLHTDNKVIQNTLTGVGFPFDPGMAMAESLTVVCKAWVWYYT